MDQQGDILLVKLFELMQLERLEIPHSRLISTKDGYDMCHTMLGAGKIAKGSESAL